MKSPLVSLSLCTLLLLVSCGTSPTPTTTNSNQNANTATTSSSAKNSIVNENVEEDEEDEDYAETNVNAQSVNKNLNKNQGTVEQTKKEPVSAKPVQFQGTWFSISYPGNFSVKNQEAKTVTQGEKPLIEEAYFTSPDKKVEFYIYSPQWSGTSTYMNARTNELLADEKEETTGTGLAKTTTTWKTFKAKDGSYMRSLVKIQGQVDTGSEVTHIFGYQYKDQNAYEQYRDAYIAFKKSLQQFAD